MSIPRRRFKKILPPLAPEPRPVVMKTPLPMAGARRHVLTARPDGEIVWFDWAEHHAAITKKVIQQKVRTEENWK
jgi:hypothetical protein